MLSKHILQRLCQQWNLPLPQLSDNAWRALKSYSFPGNVRELENILERALTLSDGRQIDTAHLQLPDSEPSFAVEPNDPQGAASTSMPSRPAEIGRASCRERV